MALACSACSNNANKNTNAQNNSDMSNAAIENIMTRTSIRAYTDQAVEPEKIETMLKAAMAAPTAMNKQPWHFVVVSNREKLDSLAEGGPRKGLTANAPLAIVVCGDKEDFFDGPEFWVEDCSAATENLLLAAHALGLGAVWTGAYPGVDRSVPIAQKLGLSDNLIPMAMVVIGYPAENPAPKDKWNPENVTYVK